MHKKSQENLDSAELLINAGKYTSSIHCSYYAVFQYMKYALSRSPIIPMSYNKQNQMTTHGKTHVRILCAFKKRVQRIDGNSQDSTSVGNRIEILKDNRINADYRENFIFDETKSKDCLREAKSIIELIKNKFGI